MPRYFFETSGPGGECRDEEGTILLDVDAAQRYARRALCEIAGDCLKGGHVTFVVRVLDMTGSEVYRASIALTEPHKYGSAPHPDQQVHAAPANDAVERHP
ncbi:hypothetical protein MMSR116_06340 [Methylobacterium mesophilicum SR1.6/6]|uniref:DUF6894 domain-containing protein n=1 Tax=Methylobacterium mesophilicum SR1.6/6 TaxID=908290 RepID=A0A6B9FKA8_9HYPH|nr:hypothetical protein [Methylobacterium mesophilicum]QGY01565.1 hypothetical protein MMSR116_06340 [Methylobacterium mesophilicum SR1.6/6]